MGVQGGPGRGTSRFRTLGAIGWYRQGRAKLNTPAGYRTVPWGRPESGRSPLFAVHTSGVHAFLSQKARARQKVSSSKSRLLFSKYTTAPAAGAAGGTAADSLNHSSNLTVKRVSKYGHFRPIFLTPPSRFTVDYVAACCGAKTLLDSSELRGHGARNAARQARP